MSPLRAAAIAAYWHSELAYARYVDAELDGVALSALALATRDVQLFSSLYLRLTRETHPRAESPPLARRRRP